MLLDTWYLTSVKWTLNTDLVDIIGFYTTLTHINYKKSITYVTVCLILKKKTFKLVKVRTRRLAMSISCLCLWSGVFLTRKGALFLLLPMLFFFINAFVLQVLYIYLPCSSWGSTLRAPTWKWPAEERLVVAVSALFQDEQVEMVGGLHVATGWKI